MVRTLMNKSIYPYTYAFVFSLHKIACIKMNQYSDSPTLVCVDNLPTNIYAIEVSPGFSISLVDSNYFILKTVTNATKQIYIDANAKYLLISKVGSTSNNCTIIISAIEDYSTLNIEYDIESNQQEVFIKFSEKRPNFTNEEHEKAWFIRVTINLSKNINKSAWNRRVITLDESITFENKEETNVFSVVSELPQNYKTVIYLSYYEGYKVKEIAYLMNKREGTIKTWLYRAREILKQKLEGGFENE